MIVIYNDEMVPMGYIEKGRHVDFSDRLTYLFSISVDVRVSPKDTVDRYVTKNNPTLEERLDWLTQFGYFAIGNSEDENEIKKEWIDPYTSKIYEWIDEMIEKAGGLKIPGKHLKPAKEEGKLVESSLYTSIHSKIGKHLNTLSPKATQAEIIYGTEDIINTWVDEFATRADEFFMTLFLMGAAAGIIDSGVEPAIDSIDKNAMDVIAADPKRIGSRIKIFGDDVIEKFRAIIMRSYTPEGDFDLDALVKEMSKVIPTQRYKLERIARTETAAVSNLGRLYSWHQDPDKYFYTYIWQHTPDNRAKYVSLWRGARNPYSFEEICFLFQKQNQNFGGKIGWQNDIFNNRCSVSRSSSNVEKKGNRFRGQEANFIDVVILGFDYRDEGMI